jgi:signal transduction histidine kinase
LFGCFEVLLMAGGVFAFAAAPFALLHAKRPNAEHGLTAALSFVCSATTLAWARELGTGFGPSRLEPMLRRILLLVAFALVGELALVSSPARKRGRAALYGLVATCGAVASVGEIPLRYADLLLYALGALATILLTSSLARALTSRGSEVRLAIVGAGLLLVAIFHDALIGASAHSSGPFVPFGMVALLLGLTAKLALEHVALGDRLDARKRELRSKTRELLHSNHELREAQATLSSKEHLAAVGELAAVVAHEVRNPLAILANAVASLRKEALTAEDRTTLLEIMDSEATRLNRIVTDLLRYSRPLTLEQGSVRVGELLERALALATHRDAVRVERQMLLEEARVWADPNLLRQVLDNLIDNAMQAMEAGGALTVRVRASDEGFVAIDVVDTGEGMDTAVRARAKDPFFTTRPSGTGLGLAIVDRIVSAHGGRVEIDSRTGEGTTVTVHLLSSLNDPVSGRSSSDPPEPRRDPPFAVESESPKASSGPPRSRGTLAGPRRETT